MSKKAWTLAELTIAITILLILTAASISVTKNINVNKTKMNLYAAIRNLTMANIAIKEKPLSYSLFYPKSAEEYDADDTKTNDWYCMNVADAFSMKIAPNCLKSAAANTVNITLMNGVTYMGLATPWKEVYPDLFYKNITIDTNGASSPNALGIDIFPVRVFKGKKYDGLTMDGIIMPVNCTSDKIYNSTDEINLGNDDSKKHPSCTAEYDFLADTNFFAQNIYRVMEVPNKANPRARMIVGSLSTAKADCLAHGGKGYLSEKQCAELGFSLHQHCANKRTCKGCKAEDDSYNICPEGGDEATCEALAEANEVEISLNHKYTYECFYLMDKPSSGLGVLGNGALGSLDL